MYDALNATDVRKHWSQFNDDIIREGPRFVKRNRDSWAAVSTEHFQKMLADYTFNLNIFNEEDGSVTVTIEGFDLVENGDTLEDAIDLIIEELINYAEDYMADFNKYFNSPNRKHHFPYVMNVLTQSDKDMVKELVECPVGGK